MSHHSAETAIAAVLESPSTSRWLRDALSAALGRDAVDAVNDAEVLLDLLSGRLEGLFKTVTPPPGS